MSYPIGLQVLRAKVRGFQSAGITISSRISKSEKERKNRLWNEKRALGTHCRYHLVAYGLLRGVRYDQIERCAPNNQLDPKRVFEIMKAHASWQQLTYTPVLTLERVEAMLAASEGPVKSVSSETGSSSESPTAASVPDVSKPSGVLPVVKRFLGLSESSQTDARNAR